MTQQGKTLQNAVIGVVVSTVLFLVPVVSVVAPLAGGATAGYLQKEGAGGGMKVGAVKGFLMVVPSLLIGAVATSIFVGIPIIGNLLAGSVVIIAVILTFYSIIVGIVGGLIGGIIGGTGGSPEVTHVVD